ncbi:hypothetical protein [Burkholderia phage BCSR129]|nr:hypothetical protein [Burkholderia phage BCSR129]
MSKVYKNYGYGVNMSKQDMLDIVAAMADGAVVETNDATVNPWQPVDPDHFQFVKTLKYRVSWDQPSIDWNQVAPEYKYVARNSDGSAWAFPAKPNWSERLQAWTPTTTNVANARIFTSFVPGNCAASDSLIIRTF